MLLGTVKSVVRFTLLGSCVQAIRIFPNPASLPGVIPAACRQSLSNNIVCGPSLVQPFEIEKNVPYDVDFLNEYCNSTCTASVQTWTNAVNTRCGNTKYAFPGNISRSGNDFAVPFQWAHTSICAKGGTPARFCYPDVTNHTLQPCDDCTLKFYAAMLNSTYGTRRMTEKIFKAELSSCGASPTKYPYTIAPVIALPPLSPTTPVRNCRGTNYTVKAGDTCKSIAAANSLAIDRFQADNSIDFNCNSLVIGSKVCIQDACKLYTIKKGETCRQILGQQPFTMNELVAWNPILETGCSNTTFLEERSICITPPGTQRYDDTNTATFVWTWTAPSGSWVAGPTLGMPVGNSSTALQFSVPTTTLRTEPGAFPTAYFANCPVGFADYDNGFDWELLSEECQQILEPYCNPILTGIPLASTMFPTSCLPSAVLASATDVNSEE